jgi:hypothetical protein
MKNLFLAVLLLLFSSQAFAQTSPPTQVVKKFVGAPTVLKWDYDVAEETQITHFNLCWVDDLTKTTIVLKSVPKTDRTTTVAAFYSAGFSLTYFNMVAVKTMTAPAPDEVSDPSNTVAIQRIGKPVTNLRF